MIYKAFEQSDIVSGRSVKVSTGYFATGSLTQVQDTFASSSVQDVISGSNRYDVYNGYYYTDVFSTDSDVDKTAATHIFSIAYGNASGSGTSYDEYTNVKAHPTLAVWQQYVNELNGGQSFSVKSQSSVNGTISTVSLDTDFVALGFNSQKFKDTIDPGQFQMTLKNDVTGKYWRIIDDSSLVGQNSGSNGVYNLTLGQINDDGTVNYWKYDSSLHGWQNGALSSSQNYDGSASDAFYYPPSTAGTDATVGGIGLFYPKSGVVVFNPDFLAIVSHGSGIEIPPLSKTNSYRNHYPDSSINVANQRTKSSVYNMIIGSSDNMRIRYSEYVPSRHYFVRVKNREFNYTNNPTFSYQSSVTDSNGDFHQRGDIIQSEFLAEPKVYPTSVGLYNSNNELVAVAKLSNPKVKTFTNELLIKVRLDF